MFWLPIIGPIIQGIVSIFTKVEDTQLGKYKSDVELDQGVIAGSTTVTTSFHDDLGVKITRDLIMFPVAVWISLVTWDNIVAYEWPWLKIVVAQYPQGSGLELLPYAVLTFLFGVTAMNIWRR